MSKKLTVQRLKQLLSADLGEWVLDSNAFDVWLGRFQDQPSVGLGDFTLSKFVSLPYLTRGEWTEGLDLGLQVARAAVIKPMAIGTLSSNGDRNLTNTHDFWRGSIGADKVAAGGGHDVLSLGSGADTAHGGSGNDLIFGEGGRDSIVGGAGNDTVLGGADRDLLYGWNGSDLIFGGTGNDGLYGNEGNDTLYGGDGNDYICGGSEKDFLFGGAGSDTFAFRGQAPDSVTIIKDFEVLHDHQLITASVANGPLRPDMITEYSNGLMIEFSDGRAILYENVWDEAALFASMSLFE